MKSYRGLKTFAEVEITEPTDDVRRASKVAESLPALGNLFREGVVFKDADANVARQTGLERTLSQSRPDVERLGGDVIPFQAAAYERTCEVITAGPDVICGWQNKVYVVNLEQKKIRWSHPVDGNAIGLAVADGRLLVATTKGLIYCFADAQEQKVAPGNTGIVESASPSDSAITTNVARDVLLESGVQEGFCLVVNCGDGRTALALARQSDLHVIGLESDAAKVEQARRMLAKAGVYGHRVSIIHGQLHNVTFPKYFADLIVSVREPNSQTKTAQEKLLAKFQRPNGGVVCLVEDGRCRIQRRGPLPGAGRWTHQNSNPANTLCSDDAIVRGPLEIAWFRDGVIEIADRHAQGPAPLFNNGILVVEGVHGLCGLDAYNGRTRWTYTVADILADWDGVHHDVGIGDTGSNFCLSDDSVFVRSGPSCLKIDLRTGQKIAEFTAPDLDDTRVCNWGFVAFADGLLFGSVLNDQHKVSPRYPDIRLRTESVLFFAMDPQTGDIRWKYKPKHSIRNNTIAITDGRVILIDRPLSSPDRIEQPRANGKHRPLLEEGEHAEGTLVALNAKNGQVIWTNDQGIWGTQMAANSDARTLLMCYQGVKHSFFKLPSEIGGRLAAFDMDSGQKLWDRPATYKTRPVINGNIIYAEGGAWNLKTGEEMPWAFQRSYGCGQIAASRHLMLFRSATLGYLDLTRNVGTENFGGIRTSCWFNAIPAGGMVLVPDGSAKCACSYQMRAWLALQPREPNFAAPPE